MEPVATKDPVSDVNDRSRHVPPAPEPGLNLLDLTGASAGGSRSISDISRELGADLLLSDPFHKAAGRRGGDLPVLGENSSYSIDSLTGRVTANPTMRTDIWTKADQDKADAINKRGFSYGLDPVTGRVSAFPNKRNDLYTKADAERDKTIRDRGWFYGLDPSTGKVVHFKSGAHLE